MMTPGQQIGVNAASSAIGGLIGLGTTALQHKYNKELAEYQNDMNIENWNMQNTYNSPIEQRKRLEEAGLNPALMYGGGATSTANASSLPSYQQMGVDISNNMLSAMQMAQMAANIRNTEADTEGKKIDNGYKSAMNEAIINNYLQDTKTKRSQEVYTYRLTDKTEIDMSVAQAQLDILYQDLVLRQAQTKNVEQETALKKAQEGLLIFQQTLVQAQTKNVEADTFLKKSQKNVQDTIAAYNAAKTRETNELLPYRQRNISSSTGLMNQQKYDLGHTFSERTGLMTAQQSFYNAKALIEQWEANYRNQTGFSPDAGLMQLIGQFCGNLSMAGGGLLSKIFN